MKCIEFGKLHGLGNDFLVTKTGESGEPVKSLSQLAQDICDQHLGVGADGIMYYLPTVNDSQADFSTLIFNADGSQAEMSGNGVRILAAYLYHSGEHTGQTVRIRTVCGIRNLRLLAHEGNIYTFESSMGKPTTDPSMIPCLLAPGPAPIIDFPITVGGGQVRVTVSSMGNPHCSTFWEDVSHAPFEALGPQLERHGSFPNRTNVEFVQVLDRHRLRVRFWERGVGHTFASGTGSCGASVAAILNNLVESPVTVETELGSLLVRWNPGEELHLTGPAEFICRGQYALKKATPVRA
jgi:diaminopimelate epimerase